MPQISTDSKSLDISILPTTIKLRLPTPAFTMDVCAIVAAAAGSRGIGTDGKLVSAQYT